MPTPWDLLTSKVDPPSAGDLLRNAIGQQQGKTLTGLGPPGMAAGPVLPIHPHPVHLQPYRPVAAQPGRVMGPMASSAASRALYDAMKKAKLSGMVDIIPRPKPDRVKPKKR